MQASTLTLFIACQWCAEEGRKKEAHRLRNGFFMHKMTKEKIAKIDGQTYLRTSKRSENSWTINRKCRHVWDKYKVRKEKGKRIILLLQTAMASNLPVSIMVKFLFASRWALCCGLQQSIVLCASHKGFALPVRSTVVMPCQDFRLLTQSTKYVIFVHKSGVHTCYQVGRTSRTYLGP